VVFGWLDMPGGRDRAGGNDRRIAGVNFGTNNRFQVDLPSAGDYNIWVAMGDHDAAQTACKITIRDNTTILLDWPSRHRKRQALPKSGP
jgi:hypothetical protein